MSKAPYQSYGEFTRALGEWGERHQLNMAANWQEIAQSIAAHGFRCTCQVAEPVCPCHAGVIQARKDGECACGLYHTRDAR